MLVLELYFGEWPLAPVTPYKIPRFMMVAYGASEDTSWPLPLCSFPAMIQSHVETYQNVTKNRCILGYYYPLLNYICGWLRSVV
jgi:hypothetical protein